MVIRQALDEAKTELSHAEMEAAKWQSAMETREKEIQAEFQEWTNTWGEEARGWKEEEFNWELERRLWDAFAKIQKGRRLLAKRHLQGEDLQQQVKEISAARDGIEVWKLDFFLIYTFPFLSFPWTFLGLSTCRSIVVTFFDSECFVMNGMNGVNGYSQNGLQGGL
jgi:hypothetical protein